MAVATLSKVTLNSNMVVDTTKGLQYVFHYSLISLHRLERLGAKPVSARCVRHEP